MLTSTFLLAGTLLTSTFASPIVPRQQSNNRLNVTDARWDGQCFYPEPDDDFKLDDYYGRWYQVAGTVAPFTAGCKCIYAEYSLNVSFQIYIPGSKTQNNRTDTDSTYDSPTEQSMLKTAVKQMAKKSQSKAPQQS